MELIERYLNEVGRRLPQEKRDDIRKELRSALEDALEDRSFGTPGQSDVVAVLEEFGSPQAVAASYSGDRYLIGPELYPPFVTTVKVVATVLAALVVLGSLTSLASSTPGIGDLATKLGGLVSNLFDSLVTSLGIIVVVFALLERLDLKIDFEEKKKLWNPLELPAVRDVDIVGRFDSIAGIVFPAVILFLINQFKSYIGLRVGTADGGFSVGISSESGGELLLNDVFLDVLPWLNASLVLPMILCVWQVWSGRWNLPTRLLKIAFDVFGLYVLYRICLGFLGAQGQLLDAGLPPKVGEVVVQIVGWAPWIVGAIVLFGAGSHLFKAYRSSRM